MSRISSLCIFLILFFLVSAISSSLATDNLITNPGFENDTIGWDGFENNNMFSIDSSTHKSGNKSLKFTSVAPISNIQSVWYKTVAIPGHKYKFGSWVKVQDFPASGGGIAVDVVWFDKDTKLQINRKTSEYLIGTNYNWTYIYCETASPMPANVGEIWFLLQVRTGSSGTAWFDDVSLEMLDDTVFTPRYKYPNYRYTILPNKPKYINLLFDYTAGSSIQGLSKIIKVSIKDANGIEISSAKITPSENKPEQNRININLTTVQPGTYTVTCNLTDITSSIALRTVTLPLIIKKPDDSMPSVYIDSQNRCVVDGKLFFPRGFYMNLYSDMPATLTKFASAGFNTTLNYSWAKMSLSSMRDVLDAHQLKGMKAIACLNAMYDNIYYKTTNIDGITGNDNMTTYIANGIKDKPALLAYYINDELIDWVVPQLQHKFDILTAVDPNHLVYQVLGYFSQSMPSMHFPNSDVIGYDIYPLKDITKGSRETHISDYDTAHINDFYNAANYMNTQSHNSVANWMVPPCSTILPGVAGHFPPNYNEVLFFSYQGLVGGARGLIYWYYSYIRDYDGEAQWEVMKLVGAHLTAIEPLVLADDAQTKNTAVSSDSRIKIITRTLNGKLYVLAVNSSIDTVSTTISLPEPVLKSVSHGLPGAFVNTIQNDLSSFTDQLSPMQTRIYELTIN